MRHYWDLDGFMFNYDGHFQDLFGVHPDVFKDNKKEMWKLVNSVPNFFFGLPLMPGAMEFYKHYRYLDPIFLTSCPNSNFEDVARQKRAAVYHHFGKSNLVIPTPANMKSLYMHSPGDLLIDDWGKNALEWENAGGKAIKHNSFEQTTAELELILVDHKIKGIVPV